MLCCVEKITHLLISELLSQVGHHVPEIITLLPYYLASLSHTRQNFIFITLIYFRRHHDCVKKEKDCAPIKKTKKMIVYLSSAAEMKPLPSLSNTRNASRISSSLVGVKFDDFILFLFYFLFFFLPFFIFI